MTEVTTQTVENTAQPATVEGAPDPIAERIDDPITGESEDAMLRQATREIRKKREGTVLSRDEVHEPIERQWGTDGPIKLRDAGQAFSTQHKIELARDYLGGYGIAAGDDYALAVGNAAAELNRKPSELPIS